MVSDSEQSEWDEIEVTDTSDSELKLEQTSIELPAFTSPGSQLRDDISSMECEPIQTGSVSSPHASTEPKLQPIQELIDEAIKQELMSPVEPNEATQIVDTNSEFGGYPIRPEVTKYEYKMTQFICYNRLGQYK